MRKTKLIAWRQMDLSYTLKNTTKLLANGHTPGKGVHMKYLKYIYKRMNGQEYYCGVGDSVIENMLYERKNSADGTAEVKKKHCSSIIA